MTAGFGLASLAAVAAGCAIGAVARFETSRRIVGSVKAFLKDNRNWTVIGLL